ncbi:hypothetical protein BESB_066750 [Besnoitia besnoiti]|uniref:CRAL-TRIO domain-containing protein n=1 Tax=Besnoitia besnoiti TaxID=94643 RepID=A0A2A9MGW3_BESBE|nr:hypothetical protein BESB_066750 [Besnoitia besnoiti]PFH34642.1 hypothetical protein BESB_066750 [Besnoitia besnoiti]
MKRTSSSLSQCPAAHNVSPFVHRMSFNSSATTVALPPPPPFSCRSPHLTLLLGQIRLDPGDGSARGGREGGLERDNGSRSASCDDDLAVPQPDSDVLGKWTLPEEALLFDPYQDGGELFVGSSAASESRQSARLSASSSHSPGSEGRDVAVAGAGERFIFSNSPISEFEQAAIDRVLAQLERTPGVLYSEREGAARPQRQRGGQGAGDKDEEGNVWLEQQILRFLYSTAFDVKKTLDLLQAALVFRTQRLPVYLHEVLPLIRDAGVAYWHGRDKCLRPLLIVCVEKMQQIQQQAGKDIEDDRVTRVIIFCLEFFLRHLCVAGRVESWSILCDCKGTSLSAFPLALLLRLLSLLQASYRGRMFRLYLLNTPRFFHMLSRPLLAAMPANSAKKLRVCGSMEDWMEERRKNFAAHQLEAKYGGSQPNVETGWFPFRFFPGPFAPDTPRERIRWDSPAYLHREVPPSIHTGFSLHSSLVPSHALSPPLSPCGSTASSSPTYNCRAYDDSELPPSRVASPLQGHEVSSSPRPASASSASLGGAGSVSPHGCTSPSSLRTGSLAPTARPARFAYWTPAARYLSLSATAAEWLNRRYAQESLGDASLRGEGSDALPRGASQAAVSPHATLPPSGRSRDFPRSTPRHAPSPGSPASLPPSSVSSWPCGDASESVRSSPASSYLAPVSSHSPSSSPAASPPSAQTRAPISCLFRPTVSMNRVRELWALEKAAPLRTEPAEWSQEASVGTEGLEGRPPGSVVASNLAGSSDEGGREQSSPGRALQILSPVPEGTLQHDGETREGAQSAGATEAAASAEGDSASPDSDSCGPGRADAAETAPATEPSSSPAESSPAAEASESRTISPAPSMTLLLAEIRFLPSPTGEENQRSLESLPGEADDAAEESGSAEAPIESEKDRHSSCSSGTVGLLAVAGEDAVASSATTPSPSRVVSGDSKDFKHGGAHGSSLAPCLSARFEAPGEGERQDSTARVNENEGQASFADVTDERPEAAAAGSTSQGQQLRAREPRSPFAADRGYAASPYLREPQTAGAGEEPLGTGRAYSADADLADRGILARVLSSQLFSRYASLDRARETVCSSSSSSARRGASLSGASSRTGACVPWRALRLGRRRMQSPDKKGREGDGLGSNADFAFPQAPSARALRHPSEALRSAPWTGREGAHACLASRTFQRTFCEETEGGQRRQRSAGGQSQADSASPRKSWRLEEVSCLPLSAVSLARGSAATVKRTLRACPENPAEAAGPGGPLASGVLSRRYSRGLTADEDEPKVGKARAWSTRTRVQSCEVYKKPWLGRQRTLQPYRLHQTGSSSSPEQSRYALQCSASSTAVSPLPAASNKAAYAALLRFASSSCSAAGGAEEGFSCSFSRMKRAGREGEGSFICERCALQQSNATDQESAAMEGRSYHADRRREADEAAAVAGAEARPSSATGSARANRGAAMQRRCSREDSNGSGDKKGNEGGSGDAVSSRASSSGPCATVSGAAVAGAGAGSARPDASSAQDRAKASEAASMETKRYEAMTQGGTAAPGAGCSSQSSSSACHAESRGPQGSMSDRDSPPATETGAFIQSSADLFPSLACPSPRPVRPAVTQTPLADSAEGGGADVEETPAGRAEELEADAVCEITKPENLVLSPLSTVLSRSVREGSLSPLSEETTREGGETPSSKSDDVKRVDDLRGAREVARESSHIWMTCANLKERHEQGLPFLSHEASGAAMESRLPGGNRASPRPEHAVDSAGGSGSSSRSVQKCVQIWLEEKSRSQPSQVTPRFERDGGETFRTSQSVDTRATQHKLPEGRRMHTSDDLLLFGLLRQRVRSPSASNRAAYTSVLSSSPYSVRRCVRPFRARVAARYRKAEREKNEGEDNVAGPARAWGRQQLCEDFRPHSAAGPTHRTIAASLPNLTMYSACAPNACMPRNAPKRGGERRDERLWGREADSRENWKDSEALGPMRKPSGRRRQRLKKTLVSCLWKSRDSFTLAQTEAPDEGDSGIEEKGCGEGDDSPTHQAIHALLSP